MTARGENMSDYEHWNAESIKIATAPPLRNKLGKAQAEIRRLSEYDLSWGARIDALEEETAKLKTACVPYSVWGHDINEKSSPGGAARFREAHEAKVLERLDALEKIREGHSVTHSDLNARIDAMNDMRSRASLLLSNRIDDLEEQAAELKGIPERRVSQRRCANGGRRLQPEEQRTGVRRRVNKERRVK